MVDSEMNIFVAEPMRTLLFSDISRQHRDFFYSRLDVTAALTLTRCLQRPGALSFLSRTVALALRFQTSNLAT